MVSFSDSGCKCNLITDDIVGTHLDEWILWSKGLLVWGWESVFRL